MKWVRYLVGVTGLAVAVSYLVAVVDDAALREVTVAVFGAPFGLLAALTCYGVAFGLRTWAWCEVLPGLSRGQSWAALHVSLLGNHLLPLRLGEVLRATSVLRRTSLPARPVIASSITLRAADLLVVLGLSLLVAPAALAASTGRWLWVVAGLVLAVGVGAGVWTWRLARRGSPLRTPTPPVGLAVVAAWVLESAVVFQVAQLAGFPLSVGAAVSVTAVTVAAQAIAVTPGGFGSYEAAATAVLVAFGVPAGPAFAIALTTHGVKAAYALLAGGVALAAPAPAYWGRLRLPRVLPPRPRLVPAPADAPVVAFLPAHDEQDAIGGVLAGLPARVAGRRLVAIVVDDGSTDATATRAAQAGAVVVSMPGNVGLGAAVRRGLAEAVAYEPAAVAYLDADGEYFGTDIEAVVAPVLAGQADYVVGSRFTGQIERMLVKRRVGNQVLTAALRWAARRTDITDGQSGYRAFSPAAAAAAEIVHDYNYAQVLTLDLLGKGYRYAEVPIRYRFRSTGTSFIRLGRYLRRVLPAVYRELNASPPPDLSREFPATGPVEAGGLPRQLGTDAAGGQSSTTWAANRRRAARHAASSNVVPPPSASTAS